MASVRFDRIPMIGHDIYQVGQVINITSQPCAIRPWIAIQAVFAYAPTLIWALLAPEPLDMVFDRAGRPHRRIRKGRMRVHDVWQIPPGKKPGLYTAVFQTGALLQRAGWWLIVADATTDFAINWTSMAYAFSGCHVPGAPKARTYGPYETGYPTTAPQRHTISFPTQERSGNAFADATTVALWDNGPKSFSGTFRGHVEPYFQYDGAIERVEFERRVDGLPSKWTEAHNRDPTDPLEPWRAADLISDPIYPSCRWVCYVTVSGGLLVQDYASMDAVSAPYGGMDISMVSFPHDLTAFWEDWEW